MNWHTDWERADQLAWEELWFVARSILNEDKPLRKTFAIRSAALALIAFAVQWSILDLALRFVW